MNGRIVPPSGPIHAQLAIVGARPGKDEAYEGQPFVGASGRMLWHLCPLPRSDVYVDNVRLDFSESHATPTDSEIAEALPSLKARLARTQANCILALGAQALFALTGRTSIDKWRGSCLDSTLLPGRKVMAAWHPAHIQHGAFERIFILDRDIKKAVEQSRFPEIRRIQRVFLTNPDFETCKNYIEGLGPEVVVDIECPITDLNRIYCIGLSDSPHHALCIPTCWGTMFPDELADIFLLLQKEVFDRRLFSGQNVAFDIWRLERLGFRIKHIGTDLMLAHHMLWPEAGIRAKDAAGQDRFEGGHDLGFIASCLTDEPYFKHLGRNWAPNVQQLWDYNCFDSSVEVECIEAVKQELQEFNQEEYFREHVMSLVRPVMNMQARGLEVDFEELHRVRERMDLETKVLQLRLDHRVGRRINVKSSPDMRWLISDFCGMKSPKTSKKTGLPSADAETLLTLAYGSAHAPLFQQVLDIRERRTLVSNFLQMETDDTGRYRAVYKVHGTDSGRLSSTSARDLEGRAGPQLQNLPESARSIFRSARGKVFITGDLKRAEAHFFALDARAWDLLSGFEDPLRDLYLENAIATLGRPVDKKTPEGKIERDCFKQVVLGANYGLGPGRLISTLRVWGINIEDILIRGVHAPQSKARYCLDAYHQRYPEIRALQREIQDELRRTRTLYSIFGRRRFFMGKIGDPHTDRVAFSFKAQSSVAGITNRGLRLLDSQGYAVVLQVHDNLGIEIEESRFEEGWKALEDALTFPITLHGRTTTIGVEMKWGRNLRDMQEKEAWGG